ncbi:hypothetical protein SPRG_05284 [Saprolegnia parasitica CBS 223.65]|uniref:3'-5' exonuclease domain-containing protein n=1 Tax=Saprolegnia parasitica (strain CBS 223.65) TaxID=695850 RepID=A0A067CHV4_SAPPC|nr:hypothetical protein SPRG_05284 [Saprolegnia parasitica CBS 223.65]KDO30093.1 hypothetical protein SPRG_05284 [Saprolegnia parasitica CBS 223.65]|eukprot:XP_012199274.1 hypothetical protein SPRG_05284 [Saprolegnia parasitica CBS 223.65]
MHELLETLLSKQKFVKALSTAPPARIPNMDKVVTFVGAGIDLARCRQAFRDAVLVGIDTETKPEFKKNSERNPVALLQIATRDAKGHEAVFVLDLLALDVDDYNDMLTELFCAHDIIKMGQGLLGDLKELHEAYPKASCFRKIHSVVEANDLLRVVIQHTCLLSLQKIVFFCLKKKLIKTQQTSNWHRRPLSPAQLMYAALDALVLLWIHDKLLDAIPLPFHMDSIWKTWDLNRKIELPCTKCGACFESDHSLYSHYVACSADSTERNFACPRCPKRFKTDEARRQHAQHCMDKAVPPSVSTAVDVDCYCGRTLVDEKWNAGHPLHYMCASYKQYATLLHETNTYVWNCVDCAKTFESPEKLLYHHGLCGTTPTMTKLHVRFDESPAPKRKASMDCSSSEEKRLRFQRTASADFTESPEEESLWSEVGKWSCDIEGDDTDTSSY